MDTNHDELSNNEIIERLKAFEQRISRIEASLYLKPISEEKLEEAESSEPFNKISDGTFIESKVGEFGLAWIGNIVLFFGMIFLLQYIQKEGYQIGASIAGYMLVAGIFVMAHFLKTTFPKNIYIFNLNAWLLLFYVTLKLHFFTIAPLIPDKHIGLLLLTLVVAAQLFISIKRHSSLMAGVSLVLLSMVAVVSDSAHIMLPMSVAVSAVAVLLLYRFGWTLLIYLSIILVYTVNLLWFLNNPLMGNQLQAVPDHNFGFIYLFLVAAIYSLVAMIYKPDFITKEGVVGSIVLNGLGFSTLVMLYVLSFFKDDYVLLMSAISVFCLLYSVLLQLRSNWKITAALYALYGFVTFSVSVYGIYNFPDAYSLLAIQSLLVVSMAIWFRSKFIVVMNTLLYVILLISYLGGSSIINTANISFALVALITARIFNWKKDRLTIKTDMLRNIYLIIGFVMILFTLYHLVPERYITLSWTAVAVIYFALSLILKNIKYRYLALGSMITATVYFFIVDLAKIELVFRIVALMFLALISIGLSVYYTRKSKRKSVKE